MRKSAEECGQQRKAEREWLLEQNPAVIIQHILEESFNQRTHILGKLMPNI